MIKTSRKPFNQNLNNQVIIHAEINNYRPLKEYFININDKRNNSKYKYKKNLSPENLFFPLKKISRNQKRYIYLEKELNNNSLTKINYPNKTIISTQYVNQIRPYKKKSVFFKPNNSKEKYSNKLNLTNNSETINTNCITERSFDKSKKSFIKDEDSLNFIYINEDRENKYSKNNNKNMIIKNKPLNTFSYINNNSKSIRNQILVSNKNKKFCRIIPLSNEYLPKKNLKFYNDKIKADLFLNKIINDSYQQRFTKILILLLEKYFKTNLWKNKYIFLNNLKSYTKAKLQFIKNKKNKIKILYKANNLTDRNTEYKTKRNYFCNIKSKTTNENYNLIHKLKNDNIKKIFDKLNVSELFRNKKELFNKEKIINSRKRIKYKSKSNEKYKNKILSRIQNNNIIKKNQSIDNILNHKKNKCFYNKIKPMLIIKKIKTKDNRIHIDIKYLEQINSNYKRPFRKLKIGYITSFSINNKKDNVFQFDKIYYKIENQNNYTFRKEKKLSSIQEEEI